MNLAHVTVETKPSHAPFLAEWPQPWLNGDDGLAWFVTDALGVTREVQRNRLTDEVYWCSVPVSLPGVQSFVVTTGASTSPATAWTAPDLTGLKLRFIWDAAVGGDGSIHEADLTDTGVRDVLRDGAWLREERRYVMTKVTSAGTGNLVVGEGVLCVHAYFTFRSDLPNVVKLALRISNAAAEVQTNASLIASQGGGIKSSGTTQLCSIGYSDCDLILPTVGTWACIQDRQINIAGVGLQNPTVIADALEIPPINGSYTSDAHCFPRKLWTRRRFVLYKTSAGATLTQAQDALAWNGLSRADDGRHGINWRNYHTVRAYGPSKSLLPRLDLGGFSGGYAGATTQCQTNWTNLHNAVVAGTQTFSSQGGEFGENTGSARYGLFQFVGTSDPQAPGGQDIGTFCGGTRHVPSFVRYAALYSSLKLDGCGIALYERTTGKPLRSYDFAAAYAGGAVARYDGSASLAGLRQPFSFSAQNNVGYEYRVTDQSDFAGWTKRGDSWPPHYYDSNSSHWWPDRTSLWGTAPRSIWNFHCDYQPLLEQVPVAIGSADATPHPTFSPSTCYPHQQGTPGSAAGGNLGSGVCWKDPEDCQHSVRIYRHLIPLAWLGGDLLAIDDLSMCAEWFGLEYTEMGWLKYHDNVPFLNAVNNRCLGPGVAGGTVGPGQPLGSSQGRMGVQAATPHTAAYGTGRADAWVATLFAADYALATNMRRADGFPVYGLKTRAKMMFDFIRTGVITLNGMTDKQTPPDLLTITGGTGCVPGVYAIASSPDPGAGPVTYFTLKDSSYDAAFGHSNSITGSTASVSDNSVAGFITRQTSGGVATVLTFSGANYIGGARQLTHASAFLSYSFNSGSISGGTGGYVPYGTINQRYYSQQAGLEIPKLYFGYFSLFKQLGDVLTQAETSEAADHFVKQWSKYIGKVERYTDYWTAYPNPPTNGQWGPPNYVPTWDRQTNSAADLDLVPTGGPTHNGGHWPEALGSLEIAYRITGDVAVLQTANSLGGPQVAPGTAPSARAPTILALDSYYAPGLVQLMQSSPGADAGFTLPSISPTVRGYARPNPCIQGTQLVLYGVVTPGANPVSTGLHCTATLPASLGGGSVTMTETGPGTNVFTYTLETTTLAPGSGTVLVQVFDAEQRSGGQSFLVTIAPSQTAPRVSPRVSPNPVQAGSTLTIYADVVLGTSPSSTGVVVTADTSTIGGTTVTLLDGGVAPDVTASDLRYTANFTVPSTVEPGRYTLAVYVVDDQERTASGRIAVSVTSAPVATTAPSVVLRLQESPLLPGDTLTMFATVTPGDSTTIDSVHVNLAPIGGDPVTALLDDGVSPDVTASDLIYSGEFTLGGALAPGTYSLACVVVDAAGLSGSHKAALVVNPLPVAANPVVVSVTLDPNPAEQGDLVTVTAYVVEGTHTITSVEVDMSALGLGVVSLSDEGSGVWDADVQTTLETPPGTYTLTATATDSAAAVGTLDFSMVVTAHAPSTTGMAALVVRSGQMVFLVPCDAAERLQVQGIEIQNQPDVTAEAGGQLPVELSDGTTIKLVPFRIITVTPPDTGPPDVTVGTATGGERHGVPVRGRERAR